MPYSGTPPYEPLVNFVLVYHASPKIDTALSQLGSTVKMLNYIINLLLCSWTKLLLDSRSINIQHTDC